MATDDHGMGIPVPDENTKDYEFYALFRDAVDKIAGHLAAMAARPAGTPAAAAPAGLTPADEGRLSGVETMLRVLLETPPAPAPLAEDDRNTIDDLRKSNAEAMRRLRLIEGD